MGTRAQVCVVDGRDTVYLYQHCDGYELPNTVRRALKRGTERWNDGTYLTRIIFSEMLGFYCWYKYESNKEERLASYANEEERIKGELKVKENYFTDMHNVLFSDTIGFGIDTSRHDDIEYLITVDMRSKTVTVENMYEPTITFSSFEEFIADMTVDW